VSRPSLKWNIVATYISQAYGAGVGLLVAPIYVGYMGLEAYGLVGIFTMMQAWFQFFDIGLTPTLSRETARYATGTEDDADRLRRLLRILETAFIAVALAGCAVICYGADAIAGKWLNVRNLPLEEVRQCLVLMSFGAGARWLSSLYRSAINGFERLIWLSGANIVLTTLRFLLVIPVMIYVGAGPVLFFSYQLGVALLETTLLFFKARSLLPGPVPSGHTGRESQPLSGLVRFSLSIAFANVAWLLFTQSDKLLLSKFLSLDEYACFSLGTVMAGGIFVLSSPISVPLLPRMSGLVAQGDEKGVLALYRETTQLVGVLVVPATLLLGLFAQQVAWAWTGDVELSRRVAPILALYATGNGAVALGAFPYYLQFAKGNLRLHLWGNVLLITLLVPALIWGTMRYGAIGAGTVWAVVNALFFLSWTPLVHHRFAAGLHLQWLWRDICAIFLPTTAIALIIHSSHRWPSQRWTNCAAILIAGAVLLCVSIASSSQMRGKIYARCIKR